MLKGKIDAQGFFYIKRGKEYKPQECRYAGECGDWCPLFGEPKEGKLYNKKCIDLTICHRRWLVFDEFIDERPKE